MSDRRFICRCEDVTLGEIEHATALGLGRVEEIKRYTGLGTGPCQGKECVVALARYLATREPDRTSDRTERGAPLQPFTPRPPLEAVSFATLASVGEDACVERLRRAAGMERSTPTDADREGPDE